MKLAADRIRESAQAFTVIAPDTAAGMMALGAEILLNAISANLFDRGLTHKMSVIEVLNELNTQRASLSAINGFANARVPE